MEINEKDLTPMMQQYLETKREYSDAILFYRLGDFYEMFFDDAVVVSKELELTLTGKSCGLEERAPMCGVPFHAADTYLNRLVQRGYKVAICEQVEDPKLAKGLVKREVIKVVTPGTNINAGALDENKYNYIMSIYHTTGCIGISVADVTTGDFVLTEVNSLSELIDEIYKFSPVEIIANQSLAISGLDIDTLKQKIGFAIYYPEVDYFDENAVKKALLSHFHVSSYISLGVQDFPIGIIAAGSMLIYLTESQKSGLEHFLHLYPYVTSKYMLLDSSSRRNLELSETMRDKQKMGSLLWVLDKTKTAMGGRTLRNALEQPLIDKELISQRLDAVGELTDNAFMRDEIREYLGPVYDLERLIGRVSFRTVNPQDMLALCKSLQMIAPIKEVLKDSSCDLLHEIDSKLDSLTDISDLISQSISEEPAISIREGNIIKDGFNADVDYLRKARTEGKQWLAKLEYEDRERTGIKNLRIKYNKVFGYYFEVTNSYKDLVPEDYIRRQTLANAERYTTPALKELEDNILNSQEKLVALEYDLFVEVREQIAAHITRILSTAKALASLDMISALSYVAEKNRYVRPKLNDKGVINIKGGRHPVVEQMIPGDSFIENDTYLDNNKHCISIITGPNMAGKSTYMRQTALIVLMAQIGSFVPAKSADIGVVDRIFTRVGASDDLSSGQSTFMVEMNEVANILRNATKNSLLILDEIGRGTATFDGLSIAWAVVEHISNKKLLGAKTLFATHYHELTELEGKMGNVNNYRIAVKENGDDIVFLRKIMQGGADKSYGIQVAKLAGVPDMVIDRAKEIMEQLLDNDITEKVQAITVADKQVPKKKVHYDEVDLNQMTLGLAVDDSAVLEELKSIDITSLTPLDALNTLYNLQNKLKNRWN